MNYMFIRRKLNILFSEYFDENDSDENPSEIMLDEQILERKPLFGRLLRSIPYFSTTYLEIN